jgi:Zn-dependent protease
MTALSKIIILFPVLLLSLSIHEAAHAWTADRLGDQTARLMGRVSLNPLAHIDWLGTVLMPILGMVIGGMVIGWAVPVPINTRNLKHIIRDDLLITAAGPVSNLLLALLFSGALHAAFQFGIERMFLANPNSLISTAVAYLVMVCAAGVRINLMLAIFNLLPVPPLDGSHFLRAILPYRWLQTYDRYSSLGMFILLGLLLSGGLFFLGIPIQFLSDFLLPRGL